MSMDMCIKVGALININYVPIQWSVKSFVVFESLEHMTAYYAHSDMISQVGAIKFLLKSENTL